MTDTGGQQGVLLLAVWLVPMVVACLVCLLWPKIGSWVMGVMLALIAGLWAWYAIAPEAWDTSPGWVCPPEVALSSRSMRSMRGRSAGGGEALGVASAHADARRWHRPGRAVDRG
jgi:hypothetical protein